MENDRIVFTWIEGKKIIKRSGSFTEIRYWKLDDDYFLEIHEMPYAKRSQYHVWNRITDTHLQTFLGVFDSLEDAMMAAGKNFKLHKTGK